MPVPELADVMVSHEVSLEEAVHEQPVVTVTEPVPPVPLNIALAGLRLIWQYCACATVAAKPPVSIARRRTIALFRRISASTE